MKQTIALLTVLLALAACHQPSFDERVDQRLEAYGGEHPGIALRIIEGHDVMLERTLGLARLDSKDTIHARTNFRLASITKHFTALAILMLIDEERLTLETPLAEIFPEFPPYAHDIVIRHLLQHQSGLPDYEPLVPIDQFPRVRDQQVVELLITQPQLEFEPGSQYHYSNSGYAGLAMVVARVARRPFQTFLAERIFRPSELNETVAFVQGDQNIKYRALGYTVQDDEIQERDQSPFSAVLGDGGVYSSIQDLTTWHLKGFGEQLVTDPLFEAMHTPSFEHYGFGWRIDHFEGLTRYHHSGSTSGFRNFIAHLPSLDITIILLTNRAAPDVLPLGEAILSDYLTTRSSSSTHQAKGD